MPELKDAKLFNLFATPCASHTWPDNDGVNQELRRRILAYERDHPMKGVNRSNVGGWHSDLGQLEFLGELGAVVLGRMVELANLATTAILTEGKIREAAFGWTVGAWANVNRAGDFNRMHTHGLSTWSGTYYVDPGDPPSDEDFGTALELTDPNPARAATFFPAYTQAGIYFRPVPGFGVVFPSYVPHMVFPHRGKKPRISIAVNFKKDPFP